MPVQDYLNQKGFFNFEGHCNNIPEQCTDLQKLISQPNIKSILEIGFNAGHSSELFLSANPTVKVTSFDIGCHSYVHQAKLYIDNEYPLRHTLILGDSTKSIPNYILNNPEKKFDLIFIDGCHDYSIAQADLENCRHLAHKDTIVIMDDTFVSVPELVAFYNEGPNKAWFEAIYANTVKGIITKDYTAGRGMSWGNYIL